jgi:hypothetical protein
MCDDGEEGLAGRQKQKKSITGSGQPSFAGVLTLMPVTMFGN